MTGLPPQLSIALTLLLILSLALYVTYSVFFHPLAKYPGPFLAKVTTLYAAYHAWKGDLHLDIWRCHEQYGDYVRYKPYAVIFNTAEGLNDIYRKSGRVIKSRDYEPMVHRALNTFTIRGGKDHLRRRRIVAQGLSDAAMRDYEPQIIEHIKKFTEIVGADGQPKNMAVWCNRLSFDVMADVVFGAKYDLLGNERFRYICDMIDLSNTRISFLVHSGTWFNVSILKTIFDKTFFREAIFARNRFIKFVTRLVGTRLEVNRSTESISDESKKDRTDVFAMLQHATNPETGERLSLGEIGAESTTLIVAGSDTTSTSMSAVLFYLAHNSKVLERLVLEVRETFKSVQEIRMGSALASCQYLRACINEAFRMSPAVGSCLFREVEKTAVFDGQVIPKGYDVGVGVYSLHHSPEYFTNPFVFDPDRWLPKAEAEGVDDIETKLSVLIPFSVGIRSCLGKAMATLEIQLTIVFLLWQYDLKLANADLGRIGEGKEGAEYGRHRPGEFQTWDHITMQKQGPYLCFKPRT